MAQLFLENAHNRIDLKKYAEGYDAIRWTNKEKNVEYKCDCHKHEQQVCDICQAATANERGENGMA
jgi:hypothetical protein